MSSLSRTTLLLLVFHCLEKILYYSILPNVPIAAFHQGTLSVSSLAAFFLLHSLTYRTVPAWGGYLSDQRSPGFTLLIGFLFELIGFFTLCRSTGIVSFLATGLLVGVGGGLLNPAITGILAERIKTQHERLNFSYHYFLLNVGALSGPLLFWPIFREKILLLALLPSLLLVYLFRSPGYLTWNRQPASRSIRFLDSLKVVYRDRPCFQFLLLLSTFWAGYAMIFSSIPVIAKELGGTSSGNIWLAINAGTILIGSWGVTKLFGKQKDPWPAMISGFLVATLAMFPISLAPNLTLLIVGVILLSLGELVLTPPVYHYLADLAPSHMRSQYVGLAWVAGALGEGGGQAILSLFPHPRAVCFLLGLLMLMMTAWGQFRLRRVN